MSVIKTWMPMYWGDYFGKTQRLTLEEHGAYLKLIGVYWQEGAPLPDSDKDFMAILGVSKPDWTRLRPVVIRYFDVRDGFWHQSRIDEEILKATDRRAKAKLKAENAAAQRWKKESAGDAPSIEQASQKTSSSNAIICEGEGSLPEEDITQDTGGRDTGTTDPEWEDDR